VDSTKVFNNALRVINYLGHASRIRRVSYAYYVIGKSNPHLSASGIERIHLCIALFTILCNRPLARTNNNGDSGFSLTFPETPFCSMEDVPNPMIIFIHCYHFCPNPLCCMTLMITPCSTLLKAFSKSNFRITISFLDFLHR
jgi:hypothetical protein